MADSDTPEARPPGPHDHLVTIEPAAPLVVLAAGERFATTRVVLRNVGDTPWAIAKIKAYCGCIVLDRVPRRLPVGGSIVLPIRIEVEPDTQQVKRYILVALVAPGERVMERLISIDIRR